MGTASCATWDVGQLLDGFCCLAFRHDSQLAQQYSFQRLAQWSICNAIGQRCQISTGAVFPDLAVFTAPCNTTSS